MKKNKSTFKYNTKRDLTKDQIDGFKQALNECWSYIAHDFDEACRQGGGGRVRAVHVREAMHDYLYSHLNKEQLEMWNQTNWDLRDRIIKEVFPNDSSIGF